MIFADLHYRGSYYDEHDRLLAFIESRFDSVQGGVQSESWISIGEGRTKVSLDTFDAMTHQVKSRTAGAHVDLVLKVLAEKYQLKTNSKPELEPHEDTFGNSVG